MKAQSLFCYLSVVLSISLNTLLHANNNLFLPGDAFFPTILTQKDISSLQEMKSGERLFSYSSLGGYEGAFCGFAGYQNAMIPSVDEAFTENLTIIYKHIRSYQDRELRERIDDEGAIQLEETNGIHVLFYPAEFKFPRNKLGLRYNEHWVEEAMKFGHNRSGLRLCSLINDPDAIQLSWRDAPIVSSFDAELPDVESKPTSLVEEPIVLKGDVKAIVVASFTLKEIFRAERKDYLEIYIVDAKEISMWVFEQSKWSKEPME
ncbi:MAG: hypothetical protein P8M30_17075 [Planctomycetaceae bacterium]|jgi:hypothetical protein|nr:hypothetical protein [Planctomycetaceae bacterium]MDC0307650.1 hypothetical protein [Planctomycetaceae bacterium]MDG2391022.1 hypothetical protein [Planctomycetaceae bacterium]